MRLVATATLVSCGTAAPAPPRTSLSPPDPERAVVASSAGRGVVEAPISTEPIATEASRAPSAYAPPTPPRTYDSTACAARVATFRERLTAVVAHDDRVRELTDGIRPIVAADSDLPAPSLIVEVRDGSDDFCAEWGGQWGLTVHARGRSQRFDGRDRVARAMRTIKKHLPPGGRIGVRVGWNRAMVPLEQLLVELSGLAPVQLAVAVEGPPYALPSQEAPPWALERLAALPSLPESRLEPHRSAAMRAAIEAASSGCAAIQSALQESVSNPSASIAHEIASLVPDAVSRCACSNVDVDALELFLSWHLGGKQRTVFPAWLEVRFVTDSSTKVPMWQWPSALHDLAALSHEQRANGIQIVAASGLPIAAMSETCD